MFLLLLVLFVIIAHSVSNKEKESTRESYRSRRRRGRSGASENPSRVISTGESQVYYVNGEKLSFEKQIELIEKFKDLMDSGVITREEFERKKREIMGI